MEILLGTFLGQGVKSADEHTFRSFDASSDAGDSPVVPFTAEG
jgi:hypothetical protein